MHNLNRCFPSVQHLEARALRKIPGFALDYLIGGIGDELCLRQNRAALDSVQLSPRYAVADADFPSMTTTIFGRQYAAPFGVAPMGLNGLIWPGSERNIASAAEQHQIPYVLSTHSTVSMETVRDIAPQYSWYQLYAPSDPDIERDLISRAANSGYETLVVTVDIPGAVRRARDIKNGLSVPPTITPKTVLDVLRCPAWLLQLLRHGMPHFENLERYAPRNASIREIGDFLDSIMAGHVSQQRLSRIRDLWKGKLVVKGILHADDAQAYVESGADGLVLSNHGGRQLDAAQTPLQCIKEVRQRVGPGIPVIVDSGIRSGLDIARVLACGADFVLIGRPFLYSATLGGQGPRHLIDILKKEYHAVLQQLGCRENSILPERLSGHGLTWAAS